MSKGQVYNVWIYAYKYLQIFIHVGSIKCFVRIRSDYKTEFDTDMV